MEQNEVQQQGEEKPDKFLTKFYSCSAFHCSCKEENNWVRGNSLKSAPLAFAVQVE